ncbi:CRISPR-associated endonuclease Cas1 [Ephemeroptericola cinctiostellae]|uniref:CRISPR-associated endonuclease Cas1 n=1 Tax=Ephemeroptericola cinctiostellae TaxID=2268024 RepID=A0A345DAX3_9BURK|nr:type II CRISPR-associated endonuclease Cas1 [Ephemeroptericola cinctiostellae]AXF85511.1 CRISPR-associated endonuclease Cas1 [Ephemeroptericola cinctiostellae]
MIGRIVEIADDKRHLFLHRGFMVVQASDGERKELGQVPIDDIAAVIANAHGISYTNSLLVALAERGTPFVMCGANHNAAGMLITVDGNYNQAKRFDAQIAATKPTHKRLWAEIVKSKLQQQAAVLEAVGQNATPLNALAQKVKSGDPDNLEAQGARKYWTMLFGNDFRRDQNSGDMNALLNYGYTVVRACTARAVIAAGLHPTISLFHSNANNAMRLVDDLMEPFRPMIDLKVWQLVQHGETDVTPSSKRALVHVLYDDMQTNVGATPVMACIQKLATSLAQVYLGERDKLDLPLQGLPLDLASSFLDE